MTDNMPPLDARFFAIAFVVALSTWATVVALVEIFYGTYGFGPEAGLVALPGWLMVLTLYKLIKRGF